MRFLRDIRPGERRETLAAFSVLFGLMAAHALLETARDALFLASIPPERLPWVYLLIAVVSIGLFALQQRAIHRGGDRFGFTAWLLAAAAVNLALWFLLRTRGTADLYALYVWTGVFATMFVVRFWTLTAEGFSVTQAKRLYAIIGSGAAAGAIAGSALAFFWRTTLRMTFSTSASASSIDMLKRSWSHVSACVPAERADCPAPTNITRLSN